MAKKVLTKIKLQIPAGAASPAPPVGPALGQHGVNIMEFCKTFNARTMEQKGMITPVVITGRDSAPLRARLAALGITHAHFGTEDKRPAAEQSLRALGLDRGQIYCASALPSRIGAPDWAALHAQGHGTLLAHHVALAAPERVVLFGKSSISALLGHVLTNSPPDLRLINHDGASMATLAAYDLEAILARPGFKDGVWARLLDFMTG